MRARLGLLFVIITACALTSTESAHAQSYTYVVIRVTDAYIGLTKANNQPWDAGGGPIDTAAVGTVLAAMKMTNPQIAVATALAPYAQRALQPPDVYGDAELYTNGMPYPCEDPDYTGCTKIRLPVRGNWNSYMPSWNATEPAIAFTNDLKLVVHLYDSDPLPPDDNVGTIVLTARDISQAFQNGGRTTYFDVSTQTQNRALFLGISVMRTSAP